MLGVLAIQGTFAKHVQMCESNGIKACELRRPEELRRCDRLIIPGGESTTMLKLLKSFGLWSPLLSAIEEGLPVFGTCAGLILLAQKVENYPQQDSLKAIDISVVRNGYGRQLASFRAAVRLPGISAAAFPAVFIRAPIVKNFHHRVEVLASHAGLPILLRQNNILVSSFHPELSSDFSLHKLFLEL